MFLHRLDHKAPHLLGSILLHIAGHMGVGVQCEARAVVAQDAGHRLGVYTVLNRQGGEGMPQAVQSDVSVIPAFFSRVLWSRPRQSGP